MIGMCAFMDLGPAVGTANLAAEYAGMETALYFAHYQMPVAAAVMVVVSILIYFTAKYFDKRWTCCCVTTAVQPEIAER